MSELASEMTASDLILERMQKDPNVKAIVADARAFDELQSNAGWKRLYEKVVVDKLRVTDDIARRLMAGERVSQEEIEFYRGFYQGAVFVLMHPAQAERNLERAAHVAWLLVQQEQQKDQEADSPYVG